MKDNKRFKKENIKRGRNEAVSPFSGNGLSRTAMIYKISEIARHKLTVPELNRIKDVNPRDLERVYDEVIRTGEAENARFALKLILK